MSASMWKQKYFLGGCSQYFTLLLSHQKVIAFHPFQICSMQNFTAFTQRLAVRNLKAERPEVLFRRDGIPKRGLKRNRAGLATVRNATFGQQSNGFLILCDSGFGFLQLFYKRTS